MDKFNKLPKHVAIIMDGNGRWAKKRFMPRLAGHRQGVKTLKKIIKHTDALGIEYLTVYAFSTENWNRPDQEVSGLMNLLINFLDENLKILHKNNVKLRVLGTMEHVPKTVEQSITTALHRTQDNDGLKLNIAFNYGSRLEIVHGIKQVIKDINNGVLELEQFDSETFSNYLYTKELPDPDLLIRTSGEIRLSNFLLWQLAYTEFYFTETLWPDFDEAEYEKALMAYQNRDRRYGTVEE
jgi:undecaprenyl diphosphate synthase